MTIVNPMTIECPCVKFLKVAFSQEIALLLRQDSRYAEIPHSSFLFGQRKAMYSSPVREYARIYCLITKCQYLNEEFFGEFLEVKIHTHYTAHTLSGIWIYVSGST